MQIGVAAFFQFPHWEHFCRGGMEKVMKTCWKVWFNGLDGTVVGVVCGVTELVNISTLRWWTWNENG